MSHHNQIKVAPYEEVKPGFVASFWAQTRRFFVEQIIWVFLFIGIVLSVGGTLLALKYTQGALYQFGKLGANIGVSLIVAGVFAAILKSGQFTQLFQNHVFTVFSNPSTLRAYLDVPEKWRWLTEARLKGVLPGIYETAVEQIEECFFDEKMHYHYERFRIEYRVDATIPGQTKVISTVICIVVLNPEIDDPVFEMGVGVNDDGSYKLKSLFIESKPVADLTSLIKPPENKAESARLTFSLKELATCSKSGRVKPGIELERTFEFTQNLATEPYIFGSVARYMKGLTVTADIVGDYELIFKWTGTGYVSSTDLDNSPGYRWAVNSSDNRSLLLPGQGYIIVLVPKAKKKTGTNVV